MVGPEELTAGALVFDASVSTGNGWAEEGAFEAFPEAE